MFIRLLRLAMGFATKGRKALFCCRIFRYLPNFSAQNCFFPSILRLFLKQFVFLQKQIELVWKRRELRRNL